MDDAWIEHRGREPGWQLAEAEARIEALEDALASISGFCLLYEAGNLGGAETVRRIHELTERTLPSTTEQYHA